MTNYTELSDFEINKLVIKIIGKGFIIEGCKKCYIDINEEFNPCNNWSDAGPIIVENKIDLIQDNGQACPLATNSAVMMMQDMDVFIEQHENPLRAAMIVFLMMKEVEK